MGPITVRMLLSMPPDAGLVELIERAFLAGQIDSQAVALAYCLIHDKSANEV